MRRFRIDRARDPERPDAFGGVATGVIFHDLSVVLRWLGETPSTTTYADLPTLQKIHGHDQTRFVFLDPVCCRCGAHLDEDEKAAFHCFSCGAGQGSTLCFDAVPPHWYPGECDLCTKLVPRVFGEVRSRPNLCEGHATEAAQARPPCAVCGAESSITLVDVQHDSTKKRSPRCKDHWTTAAAK